MSSHARRALGLLALAVLAPTASAADFGRTQGSFSVSPTGSATYSIPIWTQPGPNGVQPRLSLDYDSRGGNGLAGVGWNLSAVSAIERCVRTKQQDSNAGPIELSMNDRYCISGNRLRLNSGTYGADGSVYSTEIADYSRITAYAGAGIDNGPEHLVIEAKSGLRFEYGNSTSSRVMLGTTVLRWMLNKVYDRNGNNYVVSYNNASGFAFPDVISWTPTYLGSPNYRYEAKFNYSSSRTSLDSYIGTIAGYDVVNRSRLESIQIKSSGVVVKKYRLGYETSPATSRSRLASAKECADDAESNCFLPLTFGYQAGQTGVVSSAANAGTASGSVLVGKYDFNGDGRSDIIFVTGSTWKVAFSTGSGVGPPVDTGVSSSATFYVQRFLANHQDGLLLSTSSGWKYVGYNGSSFVTSAAIVPIPPASSNPRVTDNNGDGLGDIVWTEGGNVMLRLNTSAAGATVPTFGSAFTAASFAVDAGEVGIIDAQNCPIERKCDVNGDGRADLIVNVVVVVCGGGIGGCNVTSNTQYTLVAKGSGYVAGAVDGPLGYRGVMFNDDRCIDRIPNNGTTTLQISACLGGASTTITLPAAPTLTLDWNGDGKTDLVASSGGYFDVYLSQGSASAPFSPVIHTSIPAASNCNYFAFDLDGDGFDDIGCLGTSSPYALAYYSHNGSGGAVLTQQPDLLSSATDGYGINASPSYVSTAQSNYTRFSGTQAPLVDVTDPIVVVSQVTSSNGIGGTFNKTYQYHAARANPGRGDFVGFERIDEVDSRSGVITRHFFEQTFPLAGRIKAREIVQPNGVTTMNLEMVSNTSAPLLTGGGNQSYFVYSSGSTVTQYEVGGPYNGTLLRTVATTNLYEYTGGTLYDQTVTTTEPSGADGLSAGGQWTARTYLPLANLLNDTANWCLGRPGQIQQINQHNLTYGAQLTRVTSVDWNAGRCIPTQVVEEPGTPLQVTTAFGYDNFGNVDSTTVTGKTITGVAMTPRTTKTTYSDSTHTSGQFLVAIEDAESVANARNQKTIIAWDQNLGVPSSSTDPNLLATSWQYDPFGRRTRENRPDGTATTWTISDCATYSFCSGELRVLVIQNDLDSAGAIRHDIWNGMDRFERLYDRHTSTLGEDTPGAAQHALEKTRYDALGRVWKNSLPVIDAFWNDAYFTTYTYDLANRVTQISRPISAANLTAQTYVVSYEGLSTRLVDEQGKMKGRTTNALGQINRNSDNDGYYQNFEYDAFGNVKRVSDTSGDQLQASNYNIRGMLTGRTDMDMGAWSFSPNSLGEVESQTDAKSQNTTFTFDLLGRLKTRSEAEGTSSWTWGTSSSAKNIGSLEAMSGPGYSEAYIYDGLGRLSQTSIAADTNYQLNYAYNNQGRLDTLTYPASTNSCRLKLQYGYTRGMLTSIADASNAAQCGSTGTVYWTANKGDGLGRPIKETLGNGLVSNRVYDPVTGLLQSIQIGIGGGTGVQNLGYEWDLVGNLKKRKDFNQSALTEEFFYDNLYRLDYSTLNGVQNQDLGYDALGNLTYKSDVGTYTYHATKKHQVSSTSNGWSFGYDANGNMTSGRGAAMEWTSYNYPACIRTAGACTGTTSDWSQFSYTPDRQYWKQVSNYLAGGSATTIYVDGLLEKVTASGVTDFRHMIRAGNATIIVSRTSGGVNSVKYVTSDHLGSSAAVTNSSGGILVNEGFDAFGKRRGSNWSGSPSAGDWTAIAATTRRGFTGHSMLDNLNLTHMNGRVYDQVLGRFLSADPYITEPLNTQNFNRYSYVYNNPLSATDPSGFETKWRPMVPEYRSSVPSERGGGPNVDTTAPRGTDFSGGAIDAQGSRDSFLEREYSEIGFSTRPNLEFAAEEHAMFSSWHGCVRPVHGQRQVFPGLTEQMQHALEIMEPGVESTDWIGPIISAGIALAGNSVGCTGDCQAAAILLAAVVTDSPVAAKTALRLPIKATVLEKWAQKRGWVRTQTASGPIKYVDENGVVRVTIKRGSARTPGSETPHVELRNAAGQRIDPTGNPVAKRSAGNHTQVDWDLD